MWMSYREAVAGKAVRRTGGLLGAVALLMLAGSSAEEAEARPLVPMQVATDTIPVGQRLFQGRVMFSPEYLARAVKKVTVSSAEEITAEIISEAEKEREVARAAEDEDRVATYMRRYGISRQLATQIIESALAEGIDPELGFRLVRVESVFKTNAVGPGGSLGLTQLMPSTARSIDRSLRTNAQILDPETNLRTGFRYLREMIDRYNGDVRLGVLAYNRGEVAVDRALRSGRDPENGYSSKVLGTAVGAGARYAGRGTVAGDK